MIPLFFFCKRGLSGSHRKQKSACFLEKQYFWMVKVQVVGRIEHPFAWGGEKGKIDAINKTCERTVKMRKLLYLTRGDHRKNTIIYTVVQIKFSLFSMFMAILSSYFRAFLLAKIQKLTICIKSKSHICAIKRFSSFPVYISKQLG